MGLEGQRVPHPPPLPLVDAVGGETRHAHARARVPTTSRLCRLCLPGEERVWRLWPPMEVGLWHRWVPNEDEVLGRRGGWGGCALGVLQNSSNTLRRAGGKEAVELLQDVEGVKFVGFAPKDIVRLPVVQRIIEAYQSGRNRKNETQRLNQDEGAGKDSCPNPDV